MNARIEALKVFAFVLMLGDHINLALFDRQLPILSELARIVFPIFVGVLAFRLSTATDVVMRRVCKRLLLWGCVAQLPHAIAFGHVLPLNVMFTLGVGVAAVMAWQRSQHITALAWIMLAGALVDYAWIGPALLLSTFLAFRGSRHVPPLLVWSGVALLLVALCMLSGAWYPLAAVPVAALWLRLPVTVPRFGTAFYAAYAVHLAVLAGLVAWGAGVPPADTLVTSADVPVGIDARESARSGQ